MFKRNATGKKYTGIFINGQAFNCIKSMSLEELLTYMEFNTNSIIVERNKQVISWNDFSHTFLESGDKIEIITIAGGG